MTTLLKMCLHNLLKNRDFIYFRRLILSLAVVLGEWLLLTASDNTLTY